ncbi:hypothetical protein F7725_006841 [Dissostichus mawsoni]|uniref:Uncharacterized protein n=1 Tax=Dissostichus mawsoni TaxID=36200 RepID=A0A7J5XWT8_DISMA|nr:hypothetical protein F7725_006841 [Dissostichus mawsoni]
MATLLFSVSSSIKLVHLPPAKPRMSPKKPAMIAMMTSAWKPGGLEAKQHGVVDLALHLARALGHTVHPQTLPDHLSSDDVGTDEGCDFPGGKSADDDAPQKADDSQDKSENLPRAPPSSRGGQRIVETCDDAVCRQADRNNTQEACYNKHHTSSHADISFVPPVIIIEVGAAGPDHSEPDRHHADSDGDADQSPRSLQVLW